MKFVVNIIFRVAVAILLAPLRVMAGINNWHTYHYVSDRAIRDIKGKWDKY
jgi:hypothetical protein